VTDPEDIREKNAAWLALEVGGPFQFKKVERGDEQILPDREQRELDALPSRLADRNRQQP